MRDIFFVFSSSAFSCAQLINRGDERLTNLTAGRMHAGKQHTTAEKYDGERRARLIEKRCCDHKQRKASRADAI